MKLSLSGFSLVTVGKVILFSCQTSAIPYYNSPCATWLYGGFGPRSTPDFEPVSIGMRSVEECAKYAIDNGYAGFSTAWKPKTGYNWEGQKYASPECRSHCEYEIFSTSHCYMRASAVSPCVNYCGNRKTWATYTVTAGTECQIDGDGIYKESKTSLAPSYKESKTPSLAPSSFFAGQNYTIGKPQSRFNNNLGDFSLQLNYTEVGHSVAFLNVTLREAGCDKPVTDPIIKMNENVFLKADFATPSVAMDTTKFSASKLITNKSQGESIGVLKFCVRAEGYDGDSEGDNVSVSFRQDDINIGYDLTSNTFKVEANKITANDILLSENIVTASYSVDAFRCSNNYEADSTSEVLKQNDIVYVCIKPANASVYISDFNMAFWQDGVEKYTAVSVGVMVNFLSQLSTGGNDDKTKRVASRVISKFFEGGATPFVVKGNAFLSFSSTDSRHLRSIQDSSQVGEGDFEMEVGLEKGISSAPMTGQPIIKEVVVLCVVGGILVLSISMVVFKKMRA